MTEPAGFARLREKRLRYVESARENDFEEGLKSLLSELYPDNAHFIYELLQNAEDAQATTVHFALYRDRLTVRHDGKRPFSLRDIESITGIGNSTKKDDPTQIGKFGVGFKAVFAYTSRPEIRSGAHAFAIDDLFVPTEIADASESNSTAFTFPFDRPEKPAEVANREIERGLRELNEKTVLFLNHITTIAYGLPDGTAGTIERRALEGRNVHITRSEGDSSTESNWLRLVGPASVEQQGAAALSVAAAFRLRDVPASRMNRGKRSGQETGELPQTRTVTPVDDGDVSIYFPAVKESSGLRFHIHAPFASTVARDSVRDDPGNDRLVEDIARLIAGALPEMRDEGMIDDSFLATLPNGDDAIGHPYSLIREAINEAFNELELVPVWNSGDFARARDLVSSPSEFRSWLDQGDLPVLLRLAEIRLNEEPRWIRTRDGRAGRFLAGLDTVDFGWDELGTALDQVADGNDPEDPLMPVWHAWLQSKADDRLLDFYQLIGHGHLDYELYGNHAEVPIVRIRRRGKQNHVTGRETYLPASKGDNVQSRVPVELSYFDDDEDVTRTGRLRAFYQAVGVKRWDETARIEKRLSGYRRRSYRQVVDSSDIDEHLADIRAFVRYGLANRHTAKSLFGEVSFLQAIQSDGTARWVKPSKTFIDLPFRSTGLDALYPRVKRYWVDPPEEYAYDAEPYPLAGTYLEVEGIFEFLEMVGSQTRIPITRANIFENQQLKYEWWGYNRHSDYTEQVDWEIKSLGEILSTADPDLLRTLWSALVEEEFDKASAVYRANRSNPRRIIESQLAQSLKMNAWVLDREGALRFPREISFDDLPHDWPRPAATSFVHKLDFGADATQRRRKQEGVEDYLREEGFDEDSLDFLREAKELGVTIAEVRDILRERATVTPFPTGASDDPLRRASVAERDAADAPVHRSGIREQSVVDGQSQAAAESKAYLRGHYTGTDGAMFCQACRKPLPFKTRDGFWYFEAVRLVTARNQIHTANAIAMCPLCAALYKYARETTNDAILEWLAEAAIHAGQGSMELPVSLDGKRVVITFTGKHAIDVKAAVGVAGDERR